MRLQPKRTFISFRTKTAVIGGFFLIPIEKQLFIIYNRYCIRENVQIIP